MGAAAELRRVRPGPHHTDPVAVLVAEERERAHRLGGVLARLHHFDSASDSTSALAAAATAASSGGRDRAWWEKSKRRRSGATQRPLLAHVVPEDLAQRTVQEVGAGVVAPGTRDGRRRSPPGRPARRRSRRSTVARCTISPGRTGTGCRARAARPVSVAIIPVSPTWPPDLRRRTGCGRGRPRRGRRRASASTATTGRAPRSADSRRTGGAFAVEQRPVGRSSSARPSAGRGRAPGRAGAARPLALETLEVHLGAGLGGHLEGELDREPVGVVQPEGYRHPRTVGRPPWPAAPSRMADPESQGAEEAPSSRSTVSWITVELPRRATGRPPEDRRPPPRTRRGRDRGATPSWSARRDGPPDDAAQDVSASFVGRQHAVGHEHRHRPAVVGQDPQRDVGLSVRAVAQCPVISSATARCTGRNTSVSYERSTRPGAPGGLRSSPAPVSMFVRRAGRSEVPSPAGCTA